MREKLRRWALPVLIAVFIFSGGMFARDILRSNREKSKNLALIQQVEQAIRERETVQGEQQEESKLAPSGVLYQYDPLWQQNNDMAGWLRIEGTAIDYPVMHTPEEPEYYLRRNFAKEDAVSGSLFIGEGCDPAGSYTIIYGHYMKDGTMFGDLHKYESEEYMREHPTIRFDTLTEEREYEVMAAFYSRVYSKWATDKFRYYAYVDLDDPGRFDRYVSKAKESSLYDTGVNAEYGDQILTLSTCSYHIRGGRFAVIARRKK